MYNLEVLPLLANRSPSMRAFSLPRKIVINDTPTTSHSVFCDANPTNYKWLDVCILNFAKRTHLNLLGFSRSLFICMASPIIAGRVRCARHVKCRSHWWWIVYHQFKANFAWAAQLCKTANNYGALRRPAPLKANISYSQHGFPKVWSSSICAKKSQNC